MRVLGVDPGLGVTGYGLIESRRDRGGRIELELVEAGVIRTRAGSKITERLSCVYEAFEAIFRDHSPDVVVIEKLYAHYEHPATAILMGHVRGVVCLLCGLKNIPLVNVASTHVKKAVTGRGHAAKSQVQRMVQHYLRLKRPPEPVDVSDALAIAMSHAFNLIKS